MLVLPLMVLVQVLPPPLGAIAAARLFATGGHVAALTAPESAAAAGGCDCGVPSSPRGPR
ncbi:hypothetical protein [Neoroseomonas alkaliterrae]|nr:hypothetical protein [Neoroseomonas alkaliterrae]